MSDIKESTSRRSPQGRLVLPSLVLARFATQPSGLITGLLLIDIGHTYGISVGEAGQMRAFSSTIALVFALLMGVLSVRYRHKTLLLTGFLFYCVSALGCFLAPNFTVMTVVYSLSGIGMAMVRPMSSALVGAYIPLDKRSNAIGWILAGGSISYLVGAPVVSYLAGLGGWKMAFLGYMLPVSLVSLLLAFTGIPKETINPESPIGGLNYLDGFKEVLANRSAVACLIGASLGMATWTATLTYSTSYFRQRFSIPTSWASLILSGLALCFTLGSLSGGYLINIFGRRRFTIISTILLGISTMLFLNLGVLWLSLVLALVCCVLAGMRYSASDNLTLEQIPEFRGAMMSISSAASSLGSTLGAGVGGLTLISWGYGGLGLSLGSFGIAAAAIYLLFAIDPTSRFPR
ncbi:MAG: MFS transporter [Candidatus Bathyarchaeota archaeon]|nr:MAG: MFS transporter [Candidatus Bathyarchaeota archaeon]